MRIITTGVTRTVVLVGPLAVKLPAARTGILNGFVGALVRGWLANRSEWKQRRRVDVNPPLLTLGHVASIYRRADGPADWPDTWPDELPGYSREESKPSSWGRFGGRWLLIDYDRAWDEELGRGWIGGIYYGRQEQMARRWMADG